MTRKAFLATYASALPAGAHPHFESINRRTLATNVASAREALDGLSSYRDYLESARSAKAANKGSTPSFDRTVIGQAHQALNDAHALGAAALRVIQQVNQTSYWSGALERLKGTLQETGPVTGKELWDEIWTSRSDPQYRSKLQTRGLTDDLAEAIAAGLAQTTARFVLAEGMPAIAPGEAGHAGSRTVALKTPGGPPANVSELLGASAFDEVVGAFTSGATVYIEPVPAAAIEPAHLFAAGAVAARQQIAEHVRKLEDTGLATLAGGDPLSAALVTLLVASLVIGAIGAAILYFDCDQSQDPDRDLCAVAEVLVLLAIYMLEAVLLLTGLGPGAITIVAWLSEGALLPFLVANFSFIMPTFHPRAAPQ